MQRIDDPPRLISVRVNHPTLAADEAYQRQCVLMNIDCRSIRQYVRFTTSVRRLSSLTLWLHGSLYVQLATRADRTQYGFRLGPSPCTIPRLPMRLFVRGFRSAILAVVIFVRNQSLFTCFVVQ